MNKFAILTALTASLTLTGLASAHSEIRNADRGRKAHIAARSNQTYALTGQAVTRGVKSAEFKNHLERMRRIHRGGRAAF